MDNTELHYLTYDADEIWSAMIDNYIDAGGDVLYPGDEKEILLRGIQSDIMQVFAGIDNALRMQTLRYAVGEYLDVIGDNRGCTRIEAQKATCAVTLTVQATGVEDAILAGATMTADGENFYAFTEDITLSGQEETLVATIEAIDAGSDGNALLSGTQLALTISKPAVLSVIANEDASGGNDEETDDAYRERIRTSGIGNLVTGTATQYEAKIKSLSSEVLDAYAAKTSTGQVTIYIIAADSETASSLRAALEEQMSARETRPLTDNVRVRLGTEKSYKILGSYTADSSALEITQTMSKVFYEYQQWQDNHLGRAFNPDKLKALMYQAGATYVEFNAETSENPDGTPGAEYQTIAANEYLKGRVSLHLDVTGT